MKSLVLLFALTLFSTISGFGCECLNAGATAQEKAAFYLSRAESVFTAKVIGFEYRKDVPIESMKSNYPDLSYETKMVLVEVTDWRKLEVPTTLVMSTLRAKVANGQEVLNGCDFGFDEGETYLIFAKKRNEYFGTSSCFGSKPLKSAGSIIEFLGPANTPKPSTPTTVFLDSYFRSINPRSPDRSTPSISRGHRFPWPELAG